MILRWLGYLLVGSGVWTLLTDLSAGQDTSLRPPAIPLIACDPYFSVWSTSDRLWESSTNHWTGKQHRLGAMLRVDGIAYRLMDSEPQTVAALKQITVRVLPTRTIYEFSGHGVSVTLTFMTPALPDDLQLLSRPTTYIDCEVRSTDNKSRKVEFYLDACAELSTNSPDQKVTGSIENWNQAKATKLGCSTQQVLGKFGDDLRIDWGYLYVAGPQLPNYFLALGNSEQLREAFELRGASAIEAFQATIPREAMKSASEVAGAVAINLGEVSAQSVSCTTLVAYDDLYSIEYMKQPLRPYWRKDGWEAKDLIGSAINEHPSLLKRCQEFDEQLTNDLRAAGGQHFVDIGSLAYRQCFAAGKFVADANGQPLQFSKENHSNGCIATSDVFYPMAPQFLLFGPTLTKSFLVPFMEYAASERWRFPFAPHDLGTYPKANGQRYGGGEKNEIDQMPVEECGNLLLLFAALSQMEGHADFAAVYWKQLSTWANYLREKGFDPENQLCTDDFAGHMAHNVNLSAKAICALGAYAQLCQLRGLNEEAEQYRTVAEQFVNDWVRAADSGDHFRLAFDQPATWSQKYNLVWDRLLNLNLFSKDVYEKEMAFYRKTQRQFGLPLDNRSDYTKLDWILWTATLTGKQDDFQALIAPVHAFLNETTDRSPMTDWYFTSTAKKTGFTARPVVGGVFLKLLYDKAIWQKYANKDTTRATGWAKMPTPPKTVNLVDTAAKANSPSRYTLEKPLENWFAVDFDDRSWTPASGGLGTRQTPQAPVGTVWSTKDIWLRRSVKIEKLPGRVALSIWHDEDAEVYIDGKLVVELSGYTTEYETVEIPANYLKFGNNVFGIHCHQTTGGQFIDFGLEEIIPAH